MVFAEDGKNIKLQSTKYENLFILLDYQGLSQFLLLEKVIIFRLRLLIDFHSKNKLMIKLRFLYIILNLEKDERLAKYVFYIK